MQSQRPIQILDTTLRDGEQTQRVAFSPSEKLNIAQALLEQLKVDRLEIASARVSPGETVAAANILEWADSAGLLERVEVLGFTDLGKSADWILEAGGRVMNLLTKGSEKHCRGQLGKSLAQHLADIHRTLDDAEGKGLSVNVYLEDWSNGYRDNPDYVYALLEGLAGRAIGHFMLPDTLGVMTPDQVTHAVGDMVRRFPQSNFDFHPHNDYGLATANALAAVQAGACCIHATVNCLGERAGNASLAEIAVNLKDQLGLKTGIDERHIVRISRMVENFSGKRVADNAPIVGADVFTQCSGIHADGDHKGGLYVTDLRPERFARERSYALGKLSGKASLKKNLEKLDIQLSDQDFAKVLKRVVDLGDSKSSVTTEDLPFILAEVLESGGYQHIELLNCNLMSGLDLISTASIKVKLHGEILDAAGTGNGGFDAFMAAINRALKGHKLKIPELLDYEVRIPRGGKTDALTECIITWDAGGKNLKTRGVHANQVFAAVKATMRMLNIRLQETATTARH